MDLFPKLYCPDLPEGTLTNRSEDSIGGITRIVSHNPNDPWCYGAKEYLINERTMIFTIVVSGEPGDYVASLLPCNTHMSGDTPEEAILYLLETSKDLLKHYNDKDNLGHFPKVQRYYLDKFFNRFNWPTNEQLKKLAEQSKIPEELIDVEEEKPF